MIVWGRSLAVEVAKQIKRSW
ncbi:rCG33047 [Rattus norvegicus]|uniref:RCG33047 n=1 Tax=Rattus norvegicus TaxID=10116 RepID=A6HI95_RAT|nr:rCG33047 [Rattus norvegicus]